MVWHKNGGEGKCHVIPKYMKDPTCDQAFGFLDANHNGEITEKEARRRLG